LILLIDNYDSFVYNLARYLERLGQTTLVVRNDAIDVAAIGHIEPSAVIVSPGPGIPHGAGISMDIIRRWHREIPMLGVCLGHQAIATALGGQTVRAREPMHGRTSLVHHGGRDLFTGLPSPLAACRYHSLIVDPASLPACLEVTAQSAVGEIMALRHREQPVFGLQFHPEAILTEHGFELLSNFLLLAGIPLAEPLPDLENERVDNTLPDRAWPDTPLTF